MYHSSNYPGSDTLVPRFTEFLERDHTQRIPVILASDKVSFYDFLALISKSADGFLEQLALRSRELTLKRFGRTISLYAPIYISNECVNTCTYCGYSRPNRIKRRTLNLDQIREEAKALSLQGIRTVLLLTGESPKHNPLPYILEAIKILREYFDSVHIEIYPLDKQGYQAVHAAGVEGVTLYQESYNREIYDKVHLAGFKKDYAARLGAPERAGRAGIRRLTLGVLLGLAPWQLELAQLMHHLTYLEKVAWGSSFSLSFPRIKAAEGVDGVAYPVSDREFVKLILAARIFKPQLGINLSTREDPRFRDALIGLGVTSLSAGSRTDVGGYSGEANSGEQFEISDHRGVQEMVSVIKTKGYDPVFKDWDGSREGAF